MSYKHNNLMAMRTNYWNDTQNPDVLIEKEFLQITLSEQNIYAEPSLDDAKYLFFNLPSIIIVKGYALGFMNNSVKSMIHEFIETHKVELQNKAEIKIKYRM